MLFITKRMSGYSAGTTNTTNNADNSYLTLSIPDSFNSLRNESLVINEADYLALGAYLAQLFTTAHNSNGTDNRDGVSATGQVDSQDQITTPAIGRSLAEYADTPGTIGAIAAITSETIRVDANSTSAPGIGLDHTTVIKVKWAWLAFPLGLQLATALLFAATYWMMRKKKSYGRMNQTSTSSATA